jgi:hypothetical protein
MGQASATTVKLADEATMRRLLAYADGRASAFNAAVAATKPRDGFVELSDLVENIDKVLGRKVRERFDLK